MPRWCDRLFESVRLTLDKEQGEAKANAREEVDCLLQVCSLKPDERILDLYCGQGYHAMNLAARGFCDIVGVDRPGWGIRTARRRARIEGFSVPFIEADPRRCSFNPSYDVVLMLGNSLGRFVDDEDAAALLETCRRALRPSGLLLLSIVDVDWLRHNVESVTTEIVPNGGFIVRQRTFKGAYLTTRVTVVEEDEAVVVNRVFSERIYNRSQIEVALCRAGFGDITFSTPMVTAPNSERGHPSSSHWKLITARVSRKMGTSDHASATQGRNHSSSQSCHASPAGFDQ